MPRLEVGRIGRPHGLRGEVTVLLVTDRVERMEPGAHLHDGSRELIVEESRPHRDGWIVRFEGVHDRDGAEALRGTVLTADPLPESGDDELWVHELIGARVVDRAGTALGEVVEVEANPAHDLLVLDGGALVPATFIVERDGDRIIVDVPEGLLDL